MTKLDKFLRNLVSSNKPVLRNHDFIVYEGSDRVCQITAHFEQEGRLVRCVHCSLLKYQTAVVSGLKCDNRKWEKQREEPIYKFIENHQEDIPRLIVLIKDTQQLYCVAGFDSLKIVFAQEMKDRTKKDTNIPLLQLFYKNSVLSSLVGCEIDDDEDEWEDGY